MATEAEAGTGNVKKTAATCASARRPFITALLPDWEMQSNVHLAPSPTRTGRSGGKRSGGGAKAGKKNLRRRDCNWISF